MNYRVRRTGVEPQEFKNKKYAESYLKAVKDEYAGRGWTSWGSIAKGGFIFNEPGWKKSLDAGEPYRREAAVIDHL